MKHTTTSVLEKIGLSKKESGVYLALLENGPSTISSLMRHTGMYRPSIYATIPRLLEKGIISIVPKGRQKLYVAEPPARVRALFEDIGRRVLEELTDLEQSYNSKNKKPIVAYVEGRKGITSAYSDMVHSLKKGDMYYRYSSASALNSERYIPKDYREVRDRKQLERLVITNEPTKRMHKDRLGRIVKTVPRDFDLFEYNIAQLIYGDKVAIIDYNTKTTIIIENKIIAEFQKKIFKLLFRKL